MCERNKLAPEEVLKEILESDQRDQEMMLSPSKVQTLMASDKNVLLLDTRTREEHEAVKISGSTFLTKELQDSLFSSENYERLIILYDHTGQNALDTCSWFRGHGLKETHIIRGGIDAWSQEVDKSLQRYRLEID